jgi:GTP-binding protein
LPEPRGTEVALAGRSNVGKSSLINAVTGRKALARVSHQPGRTRQLNFFECQAGPIVLVDMPGYGYAEAPKDVKRDWQGLMLDYLRGRTNLRRVFLLLDARVEIKTSDLTVMELLDQSAVSFQIVLTKADSVKPNALKAKQDEVLALAAKHPAALPHVITTSSAAGLGIDELRARIAEFL